MAGNVKPAAHMFHFHVMHIQNFRKLRCHGFQFLLQQSVAPNFVTRLYGCRFAFDMREDGRNLRHVLTYIRFEPGYPIVSLLQTQLLIKFEMLFDVQTPAQILDAYVVHVEIVAGGDGTNAIENIFPAPARATERTTTSASGKTPCTAEATASATCSER